MLQKYSKSIFLTGFMGAGKSTVGQLLATLMHLPFIDLDACIVESEQRPIARLFAEEGEEYFRNCETDLLVTVKTEPAAVYATGGGIVVRKANRQAMASMGKIVYLSASWSSLQARLQHSVDRPLVEPDRNWHDLKSLWLKRQEFYAEADIIVKTDGLDPAQVAQNILDELKVEDN